MSPKEPTEPQKQVILISIHLARNAMRQALATAYDAYDVPPNGEMCNFPPAHPFSILASWVDDLDIDIPFIESQLLK